MPTDCTWFDEAPEGPWQPGWCFPSPFYGRNASLLSNHYREHVANERPPIVVCLPVRGATGEHRAVSFCIDSHPSAEPNEAWQVTIAGPLVQGEKPLITVHPSIDCKGLYHGFLVDGVVGDDLG